MPNTKTVAADPEALVWTMLVSSHLERGVALETAMAGVRENVAKFARHLNRICDDCSATVC